MCVCVRVSERGEERKGLTLTSPVQGQMLDKFSEMIRGNLSKMERLKLVALVTIEVRIQYSLH